MSVSTWRAHRSTAVDFLVDVGGVVAAWLLFVALENMAVGLGWSEQFAGSWEMSHARYYLTPIAFAASWPLAMAVVAISRLVATRNVRAVGAIAGLLALPVGIGVSGGRHLASLGLRVLFVGVLGLAAAVTSAWLVRRAPLERPRTIAACGAAVACGAWLADAFVLPRLYPAFHGALFGIALAAWASTFLFVRDVRVARPLWGLVLGASLVGAFLIPRAGRAVVGDDNLRRVLVEHAPLLGRAVLVASYFSPPPPLEDDTNEAATAAAASAHAAEGKGVPRSLDWNNRDIVVVTIDALRADHVGAYGYFRATTPNIDRLAARGARFDHAYCPTPHTSYSVTSMMTGKYMRPLLAMGDAEGVAADETWAGYLRRYGFRTAAFYPPAVFFIDEHRFRRMKAEGLGFEYRKEEFAAPELRRAQIAEYVASAPMDKPLFLWVHLFEPHEPYVKHAEHVFDGEDSIAAYDSEIATADVVVGEIVDLVEKRRPGAVFMVSADHGEEFGDHGGRYHGTTVYEEQVRVPLVVAAPGVPTSVITVPVQTIDLMPTTLAALDIPRPARVRGRDLGATLAGKASPDDEGLAFAETDDYTLVARGDERLICVRKIASCTLFDVRTDPRETKAISDRPARVQELRRVTAAIERETGKLETSALPEALRRGLQGDRDAAEDVAALLDDARVDIRREAGRCAFRLRAPAMTAQLRRAWTKDEDVEVQAWSGLALLRMGAVDEATSGTAKGVVVFASEILKDARPRLRLAAALALAEHGDARGEGELVTRWGAGFVPGAKEPGELDEARELLVALAKIRSRVAVPGLIRSLEDVRLRPYVVDALGEIGDVRAQGPLLATFAVERYVDVRPKEARALARLGAREVLLGPLRRFSGVPEPMLEAVDIGRDAGLLVATNGGWTAPTTPLWHVETELVVAGEGAARILVATNAGEGALAGRVDGAPVKFTQHGAIWTAELENVGARARIELSKASGLSALWVVRRVDEIPPPPPQRWQTWDGGSPEGGATKSGL